MSAPRDDTLAACSCAITSRYRQLDRQCPIHSDEAERRHRRDRPVMTHQAQNRRNASNGAGTAPTETTDETNTSDERTHR